MSIAPDIKDWTWVLDRLCPECGLDTRSLDPAEVAALLRVNAQSWAQLAPTDWRARPQEGVWSPLEYACHVRDVFILYDERLALMLSEDDPLYPNWDQDDTAVAERYSKQSPSTVMVDLLRTASTLADHFDKVTGEQWQRVGRRSDGASFTIASFARYFIHDPIHHLYDVTGRRHESVTR